MNARFLNIKVGRSCGAAYQPVKETERAPVPAKVTTRMWEFQISKRKLRLLTPAATFLNGLLRVQAERQLRPTAET